MKNSFLTIALAAISVTSLASTDAWTYNPTEKTLSWTDSTGFENVFSNVTASGKNLTINEPNGSANTLIRNADFSVGIEDGYALTSIGGNAVSGNLGITNIVFPSTLTTINWYAFCNMPALETIVFNEGLKSIGDSFRNNTALKTISGLPSTLTKFGSPAFGGCTSLNVEIDWPESLTTVNSDFANTAISAFKAPKGLIAVDGYAAFGGCTNLSYVLLSDVFEYIGRRAFGDNNKIGVKQGIYFKTFPKRGFHEDAFAGGKSKAITIYMEYSDRDEWRAFAETNTIYHITMPENFSAEGLMGKMNSDGTLNDWSCQVLLKWWKDPDKYPMPSVISIF